MRTKNIFHLVKLNLLVIAVCMLMLGCSNDDNNSISRYSLEIVKTFAHNSNLKTASYDQNSNQYALAYTINMDSIKFEIRDDNFNVIRSGISKGDYFNSPKTLIIMNDSLKIGNDYHDYYKTNENLLARIRSDINRDDLFALFNSEITNTTGIFYHSFNDYIRSIAENENYMIFSARRETCYFMDKTDYTVTSFKNQFLNNYESFGGLGGGTGVVARDGKIILSTHKGVLIYENNEWVSFLNGALDQYSSRYGSFFIDSNNRMFASTNNEIIVYDLDSEKKLVTINGTNDLSFSQSKILGENPDGSIIFLIDYNKTVSTNRIIKIKIKEN